MTIVAGHGTLSERTSLIVHLYVVIRGVQHLSSPRMSQGSWESAQIVGVVSVFVIGTDKTCDAQSDLNYVIVTL